MLTIAVGEGQAGAERTWAPTMPWPPKKPSSTENMCIEPPLPRGVAGGAAGQFGHHRVGVHAGGQHVAVVAVAGDDLVALLEDGLHPHGDRFLADVEVAEAAD